MKDTCSTQSGRKYSLRTPETLTSAVLPLKAEPVIYKPLTAFFPSPCLKNAQPWGCASSLGYPWRCWTAFTHGSTTRKSRRRGSPHGSASGQAGGWPPAVPGVWGKEEGAGGWEADGSWGAALGEARGEETSPGTIGQGRGDEPRDSRPAAPGRALSPVWGEAAAATLAGLGPAGDTARPAAWKWPRPATDDALDW